MIIPNLIFWGKPAVVANGSSGETARLGSALVADFVSTLEFSLFGAGLLCPVLAQPVLATNTDGARFLRAGFSSREAITAAYPTLLSATEYPPPSSTVRSWQWIT